MSSHLFFMQASRVPETSGIAWYSPAHVADETGGIYDIGSVCLRQPTINSRATF